MNTNQQAGSSTQNLQRSNNTIKDKEYYNNNYGVPVDLYERYEEATSINRDHVVCGPIIKFYPITSRGFGFLISQYFSHLAPVENIDKNLIHIIYRVTLLQLQVQLSKSNISSERYIKADLDLHRQTPKENFYLIASVLGIVGKFTDQFQNEYIPDMFDRNPHTNERIRYDQNNSPDPYTVSIRNLPDIVQFLSDPRADYQNAREYFFKNNPIPGAEWNEDYVLQNADKIMPSDHSMYNDIDLFNDFMSRLKSGHKIRGSTFVGTCLLNGSGEPAVLASVEPKDGMALHNEDVTEFSGRIRSMIPLSDAQMLVGFIGLVGERPPYKQRNDIWCIRSPYVSCKSMTRNWFQIVDLIMKKY